MKNYLNIILFLVCVLGRCFSANAANIPTCDDKKVLRWIEDIFYNKWNLPKEKVILQMEFLTENYSQPNERGCEVTVRSKLHPSGVKEMNGYLDTWNKETGASRPPSWLLNFSSESVNKFSFLLKYDLIKKEWYGQYSSPDLNISTSLGSYRTALRGDLQIEIQKAKDRNARDQERIAREQERIAREQERIARIEKEKTEKVAREKQLDIEKQNKLESVRNQLSEDEKHLAPFVADGGKDNFCKQVAPEFPRGARWNGTSGSVEVKFSVKEGIVEDITILSGQEDYHQSVKSALRRYQCRKYSFPVEIKQSFNFKLE
jgi:hypothetical protein